MCVCVCERVTLVVSDGPERFGLSFTLLDITQNGQVEPTGSVDESALQNPTKNYLKKNNKIKRQC